MDVVSYRGPGVAGGVSSGLSSAWRAQRQNDTRWWFCADEALQFLTPAITQNQFVTQISHAVVEGHYHFCNEFLWPIMHDLPQHATFRAEDFKHYKQFNKLLGEFINFEQLRNKRYFVNDYQLAFLPGQLANAGGKSVLFWHIPFPKHVNEEHKSALTEIVRGLLEAGSIGFHTQEYADNFASFVSENLAEYCMSNDGRLVTKSTNAAFRMRTLDLAQGENDSFVTRTFYRYPQLPLNTVATQIVVAPLGVNLEAWAELAAKHEDGALPERIRNLSGQKIIFSVDRADYTKAVLERIRIIDQFFEENPIWRNKVSFVQICGRSRSGLAAFDRYWRRCQKLAKAVNDKYRDGDWQPLVWIEESVAAPELSGLYKTAHAMLVNPVRDGLNLTAKEFVACQGENPGVLLLSPGAGAWHELGDFALAAPPLEPQETVASIAQSLMMALPERKMRNNLLKKSIQDNSLPGWWKTVTQAPAAVQTPQTAPSRHEVSADVESALERMFA
ncbi:MAG: trehalose-6-phosphate synthase [Candidatus Obscuribacterales bacterium]|nr:trehalose-6-phosphate synthase [Candidatus Obscuribacterales bacterium]